MSDQSIKVRIVTAASLFDGHDAAINIMRRVMQSKGAEIIHLGHNRNVLSKRMRKVLLLRAIKVVTWSFSNT
jgi:methylmalonyl-CoA mutase cobalamin-binding subunit